MNDHFQPIWLTDGDRQAGIVPGAGGAISAYRLRGPDGDWFDVLDTRHHASRSGPFALGCNVLAPFSNRISGGGFHHDGHFHALAPNIAGEPYPNHGNAFSSAWKTENLSTTSVQLSLQSTGPGPFRYEAGLRYALADGNLTAELALTNTGPLALPFGGGFHPWFPRTPGTRLRFVADGVWTETADHLPDRFLALGDAPVHDHRDNQLLPDGFTNVAYAGWDGRAEIAWPEAGLAVTMTAEAPLRVLMLYTPGRQSPFFSLEPVSHTVDAHNRQGQGVVPPDELSPGDSMQLVMRLTPRQISA